MAIKHVVTVTTLAIPFWQYLFMSFGNLANKTHVLTERLPMRQYMLLKLHYARTHYVASTTRPFTRVSTPRRTMESLTEPLEYQKNGRKTETTNDR